MTHTVKKTCINEELKNKYTVLIDTLCDIFQCEADETLARNLGLGQLSVLEILLKTDSMESIMAYFIESRILGLNKAGNPVPHHLTFYYGIPDTIASMLRILIILRQENISLTEFEKKSNKEHGNFKKDFLHCVKNIYEKFWPNTETVEKFTKETERMFDTIVKRY